LICKLLQNVPAFLQLKHVLNLVGQSVLYDMLGLSRLEYFTVSTAQGSSLLNRVSAMS